jgi:hypothetical protein
MQVQNRSSDDVQCGRKATLRRSRPDRQITWSGPGTEPRLHEILADPIVHALMRCDGVSGAALESLIAQARRAMRQPQP